MTRSGSPPGDAALLAEFAAGDVSAARVLTARLAPRCLATARRMLGDGAEAEDVTQEAMLRLWHMAPDWREEGAQVSTWLTRVVMNLCTDRLRKRRGVPLDAVPEPEDGQPSVAAQLQATARAAALRQALAELPARQGQAVALRHLEGLSNPEIAVIMNVGVEAVESLIARGKRALKAALSVRKDALGYRDE